MGFICHSFSSQLKATLRGFPNWQFKYAKTQTECLVPKLDTEDNSTNNQTEQFRNYEDNNNDSHRHNFGLK